ncbi:MAG: small ribosomal subunit Rsm22 family protein [Desulfovibrio sp.]|nr:small ribosomal subunit Rsm22 family protein [Desulfovibrio sp.]
MGKKEQEKFSVQPEEKNKKKAWTAEQKPSCQSGRRCVDGLRREADRKPSWPEATPCFLAPSKRIRKELARFLDVLRRVRPLGAHLRTLPMDVADLSRVLTSDRSLLAHPYWSKPAAISAYCYYFLPWNIVRLTRLFPYLPLISPPEKQPLLFDLGSGPLTVPIALWLSKPEFRSLPVTVIASDRSRQPLDMGIRLFSELAREEGVPPWTVIPLNAGFEHAMRIFSAFCQERHITPSPWLVTAANVLNEIMQSRPRHGRGEAEEEEEGQEILQSFLSDLSRLTQRLGAEDRRSQVLFVEPGTRLGGKIITSLREEALALGFSSVFPCPHSAPCPLMQGRGRKTWCHFTFDLEGAPTWLTKLSRDAGLAKDALSLSPLLLSTSDERRDDDRCRIISAPFSVPTLSGKARYGCSTRGLVLLEDAEAVSSGSSLSLSGLSSADVDKKSGARILRVSARHAGKKEGGNDIAVRKSKGKRNGHCMAAGKDVSR